MSENARRKITTKQVFERILKPRCFGLWNCLYQPNQANPFYSTVGGSYEEIWKACLWMERCVKTNDPNNKDTLAVLKRLRERDEKENHRHSKEQVD